MVRQKLGGDKFVEVWPGHEALATASIERSRMQSPMVFGPCGLVLRQTTQRGASGSFDTLLKICFWQNQGLALRFLRFQPIYVSVVHRRFSLEEFHFFVRHRMYCCPSSPLKCPSCGRLCIMPASNDRQVGVVVSTLFLTICGFISALLKSTIPMLFGFLLGIFSAYIRYSAMPPERAARHL